MPKPSTDATLSFDTLVCQITSYAPTSDLALLEKAHLFCAKAHEGQFRASGEPFCHHPLEVALILTRLQLPISAIIAGMLHDVLEDTRITRSQLASEFGEDVAVLVEGVTKIGQIQFKSMEERQAENFRRMIVSVAQDVRILLIKLADRLHNMRTLNALSEEKQKRIARETMEIYAPLANRMGIGWIKTELEDHAFRYLKPDIYETLATKTDNERTKRTAYLETVMDHIQKAIAAHNLHGKVYGRTKHLFGIYRKMIQRGIPFEEVYDIMGVRIITQTKMDCYALLGLIHTLWSPVPDRFRDFIALPKSNMYQSLHTTVAALQGHYVEFQIRTEEMHRIAEEGVAAHWVYKEHGKIHPKEEKAFAWLQQWVEWGSEIADTRQYLDSVKTDLFGDRIYVFTPKGDVKELLRGATPIDFAYAIHTQVGHHCTGAKIDGKIVPLGHPLSNGDRVEILTSEHHFPRRDWMKLVKTPRAKAKIKHFIQTQERAQSLEVGKKLLERALKKEGFNPKEVFPSEAMRNMMDTLGMPALEDLCIAIGYGKVRATSVIRPLLPEPHFKEAPPEQDAEKQPFKIKGFDDILIHLAKCCSPVPGDPIFGFITRGRGITVHSVHCPNRDNFDYDPDRFVEVTWDSGIHASHTADVSVITVDTPGILAAITTEIAKTNANISRAEVITTQDKKATIRFCIVIRDAVHLTDVLNKIEHVEGVLKVSRTRKP